MKRPDHDRIVRQINARHAAEVAALRAELAEARADLEREEAWSSELAKEINRLNDLNHARLESGALRLAARA